MWFEILMIYGYRTELYFQNSYLITEIFKYRPNYANGSIDIRSIPNVSVLV